MNRYDYREHSLSKSKMNFYKNLNSDESRKLDKSCSISNGSKSTTNFIKFRKMKLY